MLRSLFRGGRTYPLFALLALVGLLSVFASACGGEEKIVVETVVVEKTVPGEKVVETVIVEKIRVATPTPLPAELAPAPKNKVGVISFAIPAVRKGSGTNGTQSQNYRYGVTEAMFMTEVPNDVQGMLVESWKVNSDLTEITLYLRQGIQFHKGWGEFTAEDLAWNLNDTNASVNTESISWNAGDYSAMFGEAVAVDKWTVKLPVKAYDVRWTANQTNAEGQTMEIFSKTACDTNGIEWCKRNIIGTGPFEMVEYRDDERVVADALEEHWREVPQFQRFVVLDVPETSTRKAMLQTGEVDLAEVPIKDQIPLMGEGFRLSASNSWNETPVNYGGNFWETVNVQDGSPLEPWNTAPYEKDYPWIGAPDEWAADLKYTDTDNPAGMNDMEQARLVRHALAMAYDRDLINETLFGGLAYPYYINMFQTKEQGQPLFQDKWVIPYDPAKSEELLDQAGFPKGAGGIRFEHNFTVRDDVPDWAELVDAIAGFWDKIGVKTTSSRVAYAVFRPTVVDRSNKDIYIQSCRHNRGLPWDWPRGAQNTTMTRGGFGCGVEIPFIVETFAAVNAEPDLQKRIELNNGLADNMLYWMPSSGIVAIPNNVVYNPRSIASWEQRDGFEATWQSPERIVPAVR